jgi:predicted unusual protein kinase regulating ubiquinone biosynthesis (AarF/ABC1/UbiB family)
MTINFNKIFKQILFLINAFYIISSEVTIYIIYKNYSSFIHRITEKLASINILYVKVFQAFALNNSLIDDKTNNKLLKFTDNAPWNENDVLYEELIAVVKSEGLDVDYNFCAPINSGMISLVYKFYKKDTLEPVIIKMKRKNIEEKLNDAIENLQTFMYILSFIPLIQKYQIAEVVNKNIDIIRHQTNFNEEVDNIKLMKENCKNLKYVKIPHVYESVTKNFPNFIMMEYIDGVKINQINEEDYEGFAKQVIKFGFVTTIIHGVTHGDLHGGNILFIKDEDDEKYKYKIGVLDFGIIYNIDADYKGLLFDIFTELFEVPARVSAEKFIRSGLIEPEDIFESLPKEHYENILNFTTEIIEETIYSSKKANQIQIYKFLSKFKEYISKSEMVNLGLRPSGNFVKTQLVLAMSHGVTLTLCKEDFITLADKVLNELFHTSIIM